MCDNNRVASVLAQSITSVHYSSRFFLNYVTSIINSDVYICCLCCRTIVNELTEKMSSTYDSYRSSSTSSSLRTPRHTTPSSYLDLNHAAGGSDRAEFHDRYQNRVNISKEI